MAFLAHPRPATRALAANVLPPAQTPEAGALTSLTPAAQLASETSETSQTSAAVGHLWNYGLNAWAGKSSRTGTAVRNTSGEHGSCC
jgi:hypothetical protein